MPSDPSMQSSFFPSIDLTSTGSICFLYPRLSAGCVVHSSIFGFPLAFFSVVCQYIDMICINCFHEKTAVINSRRQKKHASTWRRRHCPRCNLIFTTYELPALDDRPVLRHDGSQQPFNLGRLTISISRSFQHNQQAGQNDSYHLAQTVEQQLIMQVVQPSTDDITAITHAVLQRFDPVAAVQYAAQHDLLTSQRRRGRPATNYVPPASSDR